VKHRVAALFCESGGVCAGLPVDLWDLERDARKYAGPFPVVAHPPCGRWSRLAASAFARHPFEHNRPGNDGGCFASALDSVRRYGGVLEHPASSAAWRAFHLARPVDEGWQRTLTGDWVCEVFQSHFGHQARKATWLFYSGRNPPAPLPPFPRPVYSATIGDSPSSTLPVLRRAKASRTPEPFRDFLVLLALNSGGPSRY